MSQVLNLSENRLPTGSYPAMLTSFHDDGAIDWDGVDRLTDHCIATNAAGIFVCGLSAEVLQMDDDEKAQLAERIITRAAGQLPIVASAISTDSVESQATLIRRIHDAGADAVAICVSHLAGQEEDDQTWIESAEVLLGLVPTEVRLAMYECPLPYHRLLNERTIRWAAASGRFNFLKDTCCCIETIRTRLELLSGSPLQLFNANTATLLSSLQAGIDGFCGIGANYMPELFAWLCENFNAEPELANELHRFLESTVEFTENSTYPASAKNYLQQRGLAIGQYSRKVPKGLSADDHARMTDLLHREQEWLARISG